MKRRGEKEKTVEDLWEIIKDSMNGVRENICVDTSMILCLSYYRVITEEKF